jgi:transcription antitermination protein NusB
VHGTLDTREALDTRIASAAPAFPINQLPITDRVALEMALFEMMHERRTPTAVIIDEAVDLAKTYGGDSSGRFVNGVLGTIAGDIRPGERGPDGGGTRQPKKP